MIERRQARAVVLAALFQWDLVRQSLATALEDASEQLGIPVSDFARTLAAGVVEHRETIDDLLEQYAVDWHPQRMATVDRNILRIGIYEMLYAEDVPLSVAINEAVELAKRFSTPEAARFVNGILGELARQRGLSTRSPQ